ncbi:MAG: hypothetical protein Tsb005_21130 [Gammaproteobacteria bacterium]
MVANTRAILTKSRPFAYFVPLDYALQKNNAHVIIANFFKFNWVNLTMLEQTKAALFVSEGHSEEILKSLQLNKFIERIKSSKEKGGGRSLPTFEESDIDKLPHLIDLLIIWRHSTSLNRSTKYNQTDQETAIGPLLNVDSLECNLRNISSSITYLKNNLPQDHRKIKHVFELSCKAAGAINDLKKDIAQFAAGDTITFCAGSKHQTLIINNKQIIDLIAHEYLYAKNSKLNINDPEMRFAGNTFIKLAIRKASTYTHCAVFTVNGHKQWLILKITPPKTRDDIQHLDKYFASGKALYILENVNSTAAQRYIAALKKLLITEYTQLGMQEKRSYQGEALIDAIYRVPKNLFDGVNDLEITDKIDRVMAMVDAGYPIHHPLANGSVALHYACKTGYLNLVEYFLEQGADPTSTEHDGYSTLHHACFTKNPLTIELLLLNGVAVNSVTRNGLTPLHLACRQGSLEVIDVLIKNGADLLRKDKYGESPLHEACKAGHLAVIQKLTENKHEIIKTEKYLLSAAAQSGNVELIAWLLEHGADLHEINKYDKNLAKIAFETGHCELLAFLWGKGLQLIETEKTYYLHTAAEKGYDKIVAFLIDKGFSLTKNSWYNGYPIHLAARAGKITTVKLLLEKGNQIFEKGKSDYTLLCLACRNGYTQLAKTLVELGADIFETTERAETLLHIAATENRPEIIKFLLNKGLDIEAQNHSEETPLWVACNNGSTAAAQLLLSKGAQLHTYDNFLQDSPLHSACYRRNFNMVRLLLMHGSNIEYANRYARRPLHAACVSKKPEIVSFLVANGAQVNVQDDKGDTPLLRATEEGDWRTVKILLTAGANPTICNNEGISPLQAVQASREGSQDDRAQVKLLLEQHTAELAQSAALNDTVDSVIQSGFKI